MARAVLLVVNALGAALCGFAASALWSRGEDALETVFAVLVGLGVSCVVVGVPGVLSSAPWANAASRAVGAVGLLFGGLATVLVLRIG